MSTRQSILQMLRTPLIVRVNSLNRKQPLSLLSFFYDSKFQACHNHAQKRLNSPLSELVAPIKIRQEFGRFGVLHHYVKENLTMEGKHGRPPADMEGFRIFLSARVVENRVARRFGIRHLIINIHESASKFALIEGYPFLSETGWVSGAFIREGQWDERGIRWELIPQDYELFIAGLKKATQIYHQAQLPYNYKKGPNSNSFIWWLLMQFGLNLLDLFSGLIYWGTDYWRYYPILNYLEALEPQFEQLDLSVKASIMPA